MSDNVVELGASHGTAKGLAIEWDYVALDGFARLFKACASVLQQAGVSLTAFDFASKFIGKPLARALAAAAPEADAAALEEKVKEEYLAALADATDSPKAEIVSLVKDMAAKGLSIGVVSELSADFLTPVLSGLGISGAVVVSDSPAVVGGFSRKTWHRVPREMKLAEQMGVALVASDGSLKAAMSNNLCTIALPAPETAFQDFGGADMVADKFSPAVASAILSTLRVEAN